ncbi:fimbrial protein [Rahnella laticis]|uniref:fimbrial protein n=1 Tax=Rahnella laticis TaxID=2787622 RepID=UPI0018A2DE58|nr:fimbrial protein [Rahnella laticis]MBF7993685.1 type 1 fimbrial protein [Rahnella laticis]
MKMNKLAAVVVMAMGISSFGAFAAGQGGGSIHFSGEVIDAPCSIAPDMAGGIDTPIDLGQVSATQIAGGGQSVPVNFTIDLQNCALDTAKTVTTTFTGAESSAVPTLLGTTGTATGAAIQLTEGNGTLVKLGTPTAPQALQDGNNTIPFSAYVVGGTDVTAGNFSGVTDFTLAYP